MNKSLLPKILVVEDEPLIAMDIKKILGRNEYFVVGVAHDSETALDMIYSRNPNLILMDINIEGAMDGIGVAEIVKEKYNIPVIFLTSYSDDATLERAEKTLPYSYIVKPFEERNLKSAIKIALYSFNSNLAGGKISEDYLQTISEDEITKKEMEILLEIMKGNNTEQIAKSQFISVNTVKFHQKNLYKKFDVSGKAELVSKILNQFIE